MEMKRKIFLNHKKIFTNIKLRVVSGVYEMLGAEGHLGKSQELFRKLDKNSDGLVSQEEFIEIIKKDKSLLDVLQGKSY